MARQSSFSIALDDFVSKMKAEPIAFIVAELIGAFIGTIIFVSIAQATKPPLGKR